MGREARKGKEERKEGRKEGKKGRKEGRKGGVRGRRKERKRGEEEKVRCEGKRDGRKEEKKSGKYWGLRRNGWAGAVSGGQGQYRVGRGSIGCSTTQVRFSAYQKSFLRCFFGWLGPKN